jgi:hypothetical protein
MTVLAGNPLEVISPARDLNADLIVIGSRHQARFLAACLLKATAQDGSPGALPVLICQENPAKARSHLLTIAEESHCLPKRIYLPH